MTTSKNLWRYFNAYQIFKENKLMLELTNPSAVKSQMNAKLENPLSLFKDFLKAKISAGRKPKTSLDHEMEAKKGFKTPRCPFFKVSRAELNYAKGYVQDL